VLTLVALVGLALTDRGIPAAFAAQGDLLRALLVGSSAGALCVAVLWLIRRLPSLRVLEDWQREVVGRWTATDAVLVALFSGIAEEALLRAFLQPVIGLVPAAVLFAALHVVPDRRLWSWPVFALASGLLLGVLFERFGYPAAAAAHVVINLAALLRLRRPRTE
jgi:membrane protease YdiL (CAAX protease family)